MLNHKYGSGPLYKGVKNWLGLPIHPTDELLNHTNTVEDMQKLRSAYELIAYAGALEELNILLDAAVQNEKVNAAYDG